MTNRNRNTTLALAIAAIYISATVLNDKVDVDPGFTGMTSMVTLTVESKTGHRISQFIGYVGGKDVPTAITSATGSKRYNDQKAMLKAAATFLNNNATQDDVVLLTDSSNNLTALFRDMRANKITVPSVSCSSCNVNVTEIVAGNTDLASIEDYARSKGIPFDTKDPIAVSAMLPTIYRNLVQDANKGTSNRKVVNA